MCATRAATSASWVSSRRTTGCRRCPTTAGWVRARWRSSIATMRWTASSPTPGASPTPRRCSTTLRARRRRRSRSVAGRRSAQGLQAAGGLGAQSAAAAAHPDRGCQEDLQCRHRQSQASRNARKTSQQPARRASPRCTRAARRSSATMRRLRPPCSIRRTWRSGFSDTVDFAWNPATDRDGGKLTYLHCAWLVGETRLWQALQGNARADLLRDRVWSCGEHHVLLEARGRRRAGRHRQQRSAALQDEVGARLESAVARTGVERAGERGPYPPVITW